VVSETVLSFQKMDNFTPLNRDSGTVLYRQLANILRQRILDGTMPGGAGLPTEFGLSATYGISRGTVRQALSLLADEGLVERVPGRGTFVRHRDGPASQVIGPERAIGLVIPSANDQLSLNILVGVESVAKHRGYQVVFNHSNESLSQEKEDVDRLCADGVAGVIVFPVSDVEYDETIWRLHAVKFPFVLVDRYFPALDCDYVVVDNWGGGYRATEHLIILGHSRIAFLHQAQAGYKTTSVRDRYLGYRKALADYGLPFQAAWASSLEYREPSPGDQDISASCVRYLQRADRLDAVFAANDIVAIGLVSAAASLGVHVPDELAIVGFDNLSIAAQIHPPLTTISQPRVDIGVRAAQLLIDRIEGKNGAPEPVVLPTSLVVRDSCGARWRVRARSSRREVSS
jgi:GntR family transcriptional regulator of arabinose operon